MRGDAVKVVPAAGAAISSEIVFGIGAAAEDDLDARPSHHDGVDDHDHDDFDTFSVQVDSALEVDALLARLNRVIAEHDVPRIKGFADVPGKSMRLLIQAVGNRIQHYFDRDWRQHETRATRLVVIGQKGMDEQAVRTSPTKAPRAT